MTYIYKLKCRACGLHFNVYSWVSDWTTNRIAFCPECGLAAALLLTSETSERPIYEFVA